MWAAVRPDDGPQPYRPLISGSAGFRRVFGIRIVDYARWCNAFTQTNNSATITTVNSRTIACTRATTETTTSSRTHAGAHTCSVGRRHQRGQGIANTIPLREL